MELTGIVEVLLGIITVTVIAGFAGVLYFLSKIDRALARQQPGGTGSFPESPGEPGPVGPARPRTALNLQATGSLEESLGAIGQKYSLASFTLATADGLLIGSTRPGSEDEAARYSFLYTQGRLQDETGAELLGIPYRGETVVGIARPSEPLSAEEMSALEEDTRDALRHWV
ncbi:MULTISPECIES: hypothetical protein [unclassified Methanoculleus]|uniref:hypothetical protein n=1 Tax=unclassified Methanoculleus TaxID=2619537 RepID=UPI0025E17CAE|nr:MULTISPECIES: hypothetical protein [unclassified Methanoculleus]MCK9318087.1 hypothetical protein [Methanoculleus sp.]MDD2253647.1 hypothetical protein [Methanoculleus sp.]MDD2787900.1 hypothetical protein [Methanoculleus sp.]MDD3216197.1 hypothetical protein [Methanoculleus sp.]MDD4314134.1 hypothetical protein [Methanoculleus sp.]